MKLSSCELPSTRNNLPQEGHSSPVGQLLTEEELFGKAKRIREKNTNYLNLLQKLFEEAHNF
ncbi:MAG: hypothetical protein LBF22_00705 [Deltaproteobacteria bacterium]|nr:hypothetical protein [Deltaproteobacteria bacterium]